MQENITDLPAGWSVAYYVELNGELDAALLAKAVAVGMQQADTLRMRFTEEHGQVRQWLNPAPTFGEPPIAHLPAPPTPLHPPLRFIAAVLRQTTRATTAK
uniref:condensation domain-containing protein n=1 Tax=Salmonella enterica TaxID=28901 RepID=UPI00398C3287